MLTVAYLANQFPSAVEPYVGDEIEELRRRGVRVNAGSVRKPRMNTETSAAQCSPEIVLQPLRLIVLMKAAWMVLRRWKRISGLIFRVVCRGSEGPWARSKALLHTYLGACYAVRLERQKVRHIHVHHGYFGSSIAMTAARLLHVGFSMTLHGSDLLLHGAYLDTKLEACRFCLTISEYNRRYILEHYPKVDPGKILVSRLGVDLPSAATFAAATQDREQQLSLLAVGRLHAVKDHAFLIRACAQLKARGVEFECSIAGDGPERGRLESLIRKFGLERQVTLLGHVARECMDSLYNRADVVVLTSRSEGIPLVLMEAMVRGKIVIAPSITGIPELVIDGKTGFLYQPGSMGDFLAQLLFVRSLLQTSITSDQSYRAAAAKQLNWVRHAAQVQIRHNYNHEKNLRAFAELFMERVVPATIPQIESTFHEDSVLQQIQLPVQRHRSLPVRTDGVDALAGARSSAVLHG